MNAGRKGLTLIILMLISAVGFNQDLRRDGQSIINGIGEEVILRGIGLGGWMLMEGYMMHSSDVADTQHEFRDKLVELMGEEKTDEFFNSWLANHVTRADIDSMASWGYNSVRLPMHYNLFTLPIEDEAVAGQNTWLQKGFDMVDSLLNWCKANQIYLILDLHAAPGGQGANAAICDYDPSKPSLWESEENRDKTVALWARLANRYKDEEWIGGYDLLNEVNWDLPGNTMLRALYEEITAEIRAVDTNHIIFIEGNGFANDFTGLTPPWDDNMAYSFHKYWNFNDPGSIGWVQDISEQYNVPLWMGEGGENSNVWFTDAISLLEENNIGWSWWPMKRIETIVSPYSIEYSEGYRDVLRYWRNEGPKPSVDEAYAGMMELAGNTNSANCLYRKDAHDAMIRQVSTDATKPYADHHIPGVVFLTDFDLGRVNEAYYDVDHVNYSMSTGEFWAWNSGWFYRNDGVDIEPNDDPIRSNGHHIAFVQKGEWTNYTVHIDEAGAYTALVRVASQYSGGKFHLSLDGEAIIPTTSVEQTGGWTNFVDIEIYDLILTEGEHTLTMSIDSDASFNLSSIDFSRTGPADSIAFTALYGQTRLDEKSIELSCNHRIDPATLDGALQEFALMINDEETTITSIQVDPYRARTLILEVDAFLLYVDELELSYGGNMIKSGDGNTLKTFSELRLGNTLPLRNILPRKIQAEDYTYMEGFGLETTTDQGGGHNLGYADPGDFADYPVYNHESVTYQLSLRVATIYGGGKLDFILLDKDGTETDLATVSIPVTGGWQAWTTIVEENVTVPAWTNLLRIRVVSGEFNLNWFRFEEPNAIPSIDLNYTPGVYPNPLRGNKLFIELKHFDNQLVNAEIFNLTGQLLSSESYVTNNGKIELEVPDLIAGIYALRLQSAEWAYSCKIIMQ